VAAGNRTVVLVDTNVASYRFRQSPDFSPFRPLLEGRIGAISVITYGECLYGARAAGWLESRVSDYDAHLRKYLILPIDRDVVLAYAKVGGDLSRSGIGLSDNDLWIAASAIRYDLQLLTNDTDFKRVKGLRLLTPDSSR